MKSDGTNKINIYVLLEINITTLFSSLVKSNSTYNIFTISDM